MGEKMSRARVFVICYIRLRLSLSLTKANIQTMDVKRTFRDISIGDRDHLHIIIFVLPRKDKIFFFTKHPLSKIIYKTFNRLCIALREMQYN
jgi:hypothetical protein